MVVPVRGHKGGARPTTLSGALSNSALSFTVTAGGGTGFPDGSTGAFVVTLDAGLAGEEKVLCASRSTDTFTVTTRGYDNTVASSHANLASVAHTFAAIEAQEANDHIVDVTRDDHTQYAFVKKGLAALRGAAGRSMKLHYGTDSGLLSVDDGSAWHDFQDKATSDAAYLTAAAANAAYAPIGAVNNAVFARKTATETRTATTTLANDTDLALAVAASKTYEVSGMVFYDGPAAGDFKFGFTGPAGATLAGAFVAEGVSATLTTDVSVSQMTRSVLGGSNNAGTDGSNVLTVVYKGLLRTSGTAGTLQFLWSQLTSDPGATRVLLDSYFTLRPVA